MRKILVLLLVVVLPALAFADFQIGGVAMYRGTMAQLKAKDVGVEDFTFGAEARLKLSLFQAGVSALYYPENVALLRPPSVVALTDLGLALDILFLRFGVGLGPNFVIPVGESGEGKTVNVGLNMKLSTDVKIGNLSVGLVGFYYLDSIRELKRIGQVFKEMPWLGVTVMFKIF
ncbi:MAG: hypothetical protein IMZ69_05250 [Spirochaetes bacterium]|nr:hypothetical protein [Spirochaetota bacterium]